MCGRVIPCQSQTCMWVLVGFERGSSPRHSTRLARLVWHAIDSNGERKSTNRIFIHLLYIILLYKSYCLLKYHLLEAKPFKEKVHCWAYSSAPVSASVMIFFLQSAKKTCCDLSLSVVFLHFSSTNIFCYKKYPKTNILGY